MADLMSRSQMIFQTGYISLGHFSISWQAKQQGNVNIYAFSRRLPDCGKPGLSSRNFDHYIFAVNSLPKLLGLLGGFFGFQRQERRYLQTYKPIPAFSLVVNAFEQVGSVFNIGNSQAKKYIFIAFIAFGKFAYLIVVIVAAG